MTRFLLGAATIAGAIAVVAVDATGAGSGAARSAPDS
jgi:hypothetical protein